MSDGLTITPAQARRLAITKQRLAGPVPKPTQAGILEIARDLRCIQIDPINAVARTQLLVLRSRLGAFDIRLLDRLLWTDRRLFHYFAHAASWVLTEDYPIHRMQMRRAFDPERRWGRRVRDWMAANSALRRHIMRELGKHGSLRSRDFKDLSTASWRSEGWTEGQNVGRMLEFLWAMGRVTIAGRVGLERLWARAEDWFPDWTPRQRLTDRQVVERSAQISLRRLGVATPKQIREHYTRGEYPNLLEVLSKLEKTGGVIPVRIQNGDGRWPGRWLVHREDIDLLESLADGAWRPRTTLLSPFDNLICDRARTEAMFGFFYRIEIYVPKAERRFGYYALPILHGERLIGSVDSIVDRGRGVLVVNKIHLEPGVERDRAAGSEVAREVERLGAFVADGGVEFAAGAIPSRWRRAFA